MQDRLHVYGNLILDFYREKQNLLLNFFPAGPLAVENHLLIVEGTFRNQSNSKKKKDNWQ